MILGNIIGKVSTREFNFLVKGNAKKFQYIQAMQDDKYVLGQILEIIRDSEKTIAYCNVLGYREDMAFKQLDTPLNPGIEVLEAEDDFVRGCLGLVKGDVYIGKLDRRDLKINLDVNDLITKHVAILAKSGSGKSYTVSVLLEELMERKVPIVVIDPHGEYSSLKYPNEEDKEGLVRFDVKARGYKNIQEYSPDTNLNPEARPLKLSNRNLSSNELIHLLPARLSNSQLTSLYSALRNLMSFDFESLILELEKDESSAKWGLINVIEYVMKLNLFSYEATKMQDLVRQGYCSIINLKGVNVELQEVIVYKLVNDLFLARKNNEVPPFFLVIEEAHNFIPERGYGEAKSSSILRQVFAEGRKFGLGACLITQRPSRVEKNALSQVTTQIVMKVTNPNDLRAIANSLEGITSRVEKEIQNLSIGSAVITGVVDMPLFVNIRPRRSKHGGGAVKIFDELRETDFSREMLPVIKNNIDEKDLKLIGEKYKKVLVPCLMLSCYQKEEFNLLINLNNKEIVEDLNTGRGRSLNFTEFNLSGNQMNVLKIAFSLGKFKPVDLFAKSGVQFSEIYDIVNNLTSKGIFIKEDNWYKLNDRLNLFANLSNFRVYSKIDFKEVRADKKLGKLYEPSEFVNFLNNFLDVKKESECWLVSYEKV